MNRSVTRWIRAFILASTGAAAFAFAADPPMAPAAAPSGQTADATQQDIRDIRDPVHITGWPLTALLLGAGVLTAGGIAVWRWRVRRQRARARAPGVAELALANLDAAQTMMRPDAVRAYSIAVSDVVRRYVEDGFDLRAAHRTSEEFLQELLQTSNPALVRSRGLLAGFLHHCDLAKFAGQDLSTEAMQSMYQSARDFILATASASVNPRPAGASGESALEEAGYDSIPAA